jgi:flagellar basal body-associated protein FliL
MRDVVMNNEFKQFREVVENRNGSVVVHSGMIASLIIIIIIITVIIIIIIIIIISTATDNKDNERKRSKTTVYDYCKFQQLINTKHNRYTDS